MIEPAEFSLLDTAPAIFAVAVFIGAMSLLLAWHAPEWLVQTAAIFGFFAGMAAIAALVLLALLIGCLWSMGDFEIWTP